MLDKLLRQLELFCWRMTKNKSYCIWDKIANKVDRLRWILRFGILK